MKPLEWINLLLHRHGLQKPDGRPLYQYRVTDYEFLELTELLKLSSRQIVTSTNSVLSGDAALVIYAAEWWRRLYTGHWSWDGIFTSIGIDYNQLTVGRRTALIETGLHRWRREVRSHEGTRKLLGTIATEGGLPLHQLADSGGWLKVVLKPVIRKHVSRNIAISVLIDNYQDWIPKSYRSPEINQILEDIADTVISLRQDHQLMEKEFPLQWLDENLPEWREYFPLPVDDESGRSLLGDLVDAASKVKKDEHATNPFDVERFLIRAESTSPELIAQLEIPTFVSLDSLAFDYEDKNLSSTFEVEIFEPSGSVWPWCRAILTTYRDKPSLKLSGRTLKLSGEDATKELRLRFKSMGKTIHEFDLPNGISLDTELPWLFKSIDDRWVLHGAASQSVKDEFAIVYMPPSYSFRSLDEDALVSENGCLFSGSILKISGSIQCQFDDIRYKLSAGIEESVIQYHLKGIRFSYGSVPSEVFIGTPDLFETNLITGFSSKCRDSRLLAKPVGVNTSWRPLSQVNAGYYEVRLLDDDKNIQLRKRIGILDKDFSFRIKPDKKEVGIGSILLSHVGNSQIDVSDETVLDRVEQDDISTDIHLIAKSSPPMSIDVSILPKEHNREILLSFPFPSKGAMLFDAKGEQILFSRKIFLSDLQGCRINVYSDKFSSGQKVDLRFSLIDSAMTQETLKDIYIQRKIELDGEITEFAIYDWVQFIDSLMSVSTSIDSVVKVAMIIHGQEIFSIMVSLYENEVLACWDEGTIELDSEIFSNMSHEMLEKTHLSAFFLNQPEQADVPLIPINSGGALTGKWLFSPEKRQAGPWLIYPLIDSEVKFRTLLWNVGEPVEFDINSLAEIDSLPKAIRIPDEHDRSQAIRHVLNMMAMDIEHKSWGYLDCLWKKTAHLPVVTFDVWKLAISEPKFLACLLIKDYDAIIEKLEHELPLIWELIRLLDWEETLNLYKDKISHSLDDDEELINELLENKILKIESLSSSMISTGEILRFKFLGKESQGLKAMQLPIANFTNWLEGFFQDLLRRQSENNWPEVLNNLINVKREGFPDVYSSLLSTHHHYQDAVVYLPFLLAWRSLSTDVYDWPTSATELFKIQQLKCFDEDWFSTAFQYLTGWLSQQNNLEII